MGHSVWSDDFEPPRRQRGGGRGAASTAATERGGGTWGGTWGGPTGGPPPWVAQMFGPDFVGGPGGRGGRRPRVRRGDVRSAILDVLASSPEPINGYQVIQQIADRTDGVWKPSPGSVYPTIAQLQDEGLVEDAPTGRKAIQLTDEGQAYVADHPDEMAAVWAPFAAQVDDDEAVNFKQVIGQTVGAIVQVATTGSPDQRQKAIEILGDTRRRLYGLLAEGPEDAENAEDESTRGGVMDSLRISDADREAAVDLLAEHYATGRLDKDEFDERSDAVWSAKTRGDLAPIFADLPLRSPARRTSRLQPGAPRRRRWPVPLVPVLIALVVLFLALDAVPDPARGAVLSSAACARRGRRPHQTGPLAYVLSV